MNVLLHLQCLKRLGATWGLRSLQSLTAPWVSGGGGSASTKVGGTLLSSRLSCLVQFLKFFHLLLLLGNQILLLRLFGMGICKL